MSVLYSCEGVGGDFLYIFYSLVSTVSASFKVTRVSIGSVDMWVVGSSALVFLFFGVLTCSEGAASVVVAFPLGFGRMSEPLASCLQSERFRFLIPFPVLCFGFSWGTGVVVSRGLSLTGYVSGSRFLFLFFFFLFFCCFFLTGEAWI